MLACFYSFGRGHQLGHTLQLVQSVLLHRTYIQGTRYYPSPDCCLFFFGRLLQSSQDVHLKATLGSLLKERMQERVGTERKRPRSGNASPHMLFVGLELRRRSPRPIGLAV